MTTIESPVRNPAELARETIRQLALRRLAPTPAHYAAVYQEIDGSAARPAEPVLQPHAPAWPDLLRNLLRRWEARSPQWTQAQKRESMERLLTACGPNPDKLAERLSGLVKAWGEAAPAPAASLSDQAAIPAASEGLSNAPAAGHDDLTTLRQLLSELLGMLLGEEPGDTSVAASAQSIMVRIGEADTLAGLAREACALKKLLLEVEVAGRGRQEMLTGLRGLLHLVVSNMDELVPDERWVRGQIGRLRDTLSGPLSTTAIADAQLAMRSVLIKQSALKKSVRDAEQSMKDLLADFVLRLGAMSESAGVYSQRMDAYVDQIRSADDLPALSQVVKAMVVDARQAQEGAAQMRSELESAHQRALELETRTLQLEAELAEASNLVRSDALTGALNRRGLSESSFVEFARARRDGASLCLSVLDVDNFKRLNDTLGHAAGDEALRHLAATLRRMLRPSDVVARYGGEEFVILLPDTGVDEAVSVMQRAQRGLTRDFFLHGNDKVLITFSAGVALWDGSETEAALVERADEAMYRAKQEGKNRVYVAASDAAPVAPPLTHPPVAAVHA
jgi:diguanylate cyclase